MSDIFRPTYIIQDIANVTADRLQSEDIDGIVIPHAEGILTASNNPEWFPRHQALENLGNAGIKFYLLANNQAEIDIFKRPYNRLPFETVVDLSDIQAKHPVQEGLRHIGGNRQRLLMVGNWLSEIADGKRAGFTTVLMPDYFGIKSLRSRLSHPVEAVARRVRGLPLKPNKFPLTLEKIGRDIKQEGVPMISISEAGEEQVEP